MDYAAYVKLLGLKAIRVTDPDAVEGALDEACLADRPVVLDVHTDRNVPPLPAHITFEEASGFVESILKRDPAGMALVGDAVRAVGAELFAQAKNVLPGGDNHCGFAEVV